jgi:hypothetical protein
MPAAGNWQWIKPQELAIGQTIPKMMSQLQKALLEMAAQQVPKENIDMIEWLSCPLPLGGEC